MNTNLTRRQILRTGGALVVSFAFTGRRAFAQTTSELGKPLAITEVDSFLAIRTDGMLQLKPTTMAPVVLRKLRREKREVVSIMRPPSMRVTRRVRRGYGCRSGRGSPPAPS